MAFLFSAPGVAADPPGLILTPAEAACQAAQRLLKKRFAKDVTASISFARVRPQ